MILNASLAPEVTFELARFAGRITLIDVAIDCRDCFIQLGSAAASDEHESAFLGETLSGIDRIYETVKTKAGRIDVLFVNAGFYEFGKFGEITEEHFDKTFNTNVRGLLFAVQKALPLLTRGSSVTLTGSIASIKGFEAFSVYNASKAAVRSFARSWINDLKGRGIRINVLSPGHIETPGLLVLMTDEQKGERRC